MADQPPVDLNTPVENPGLVDLLVRSKKQPPNDAAMTAVLRALRDAVYLLATKIRHPDGQPPIVDGVMRAGTLIEMFTVRLPDDRAAIALFTDWPSLRASVGEGADWSSLVQAGNEALSLGLGPTYPGGVVINPNGPEVSLALQSPMLQAALDLGPAG